MSDPPDSAEDGSLAFTSLATTAPGNYLTVPNIPVYLGLVNINQCCIEVSLRGNKTGTFMGMLRMPCSCRVADLRQC